ncbi:MAG: Ig-like domain-containing protein [Anaerolineaceae bacterium]
MKKIVFCLLFMALLLPTGSVLAQTDTPFTVSLSRDFGYGNGAEIQGRMTLSLKGEDSQVAKVNFQIDGESVAVVTMKPFKFSFNTDQYKAGTHKLGAEVVTLDGQTYTTRALTYRFLTGSEVGDGMKRILIPIGVITLLALVVPTLIQSATAKKRKQNPGQPVDYGYSGGAICPKCGHPFPRSFLSPHIGALKIERCPSCKKWSLVGRASLDELRKAERAEAVKYGTAIDIADDKQTQKEEKDQLDDTRYLDGL